MNSGRRRVVAASLLSGLGTLGVPRLAYAGAQVEEPLADAVRLALSAAIAEAAPPEPTFDTIEQRLLFLRWLGDMSQRLRKREAEHLRRVDFLKTTWYETKRAGLDTSLILGLIQVESGFRQYAVSGAGARGYMQVMPFWTRLIGDGDTSRLFRMPLNLRFGCVILRHYLNLERGDMYMALGRYNGSRGRPEYPNAVFGARKQWEYKVTSDAAAPGATSTTAGPTTATPTTAGPQTAPSAAASRSIVVPTTAGAASVPIR